MYVYAHQISLSQKINKFSKTEVSRFPVYIKIELPSIILNAIQNDITYETTLYSLDDHHAGIFLYIYTKIQEFYSPILGPARAYKDVVHNL